jgi:carboxymethylenebutenolidase
MMASSSINGTWPTQARRYMRSPVQNVAMKTPDGVADARLFHPAGIGPWPGVLFFMDGGGLRPALDAMGERLAAAGYCVLMPNLFYRHGPFAPFDMKTAFNPGNPERERMIGMIRALDTAGLKRDAGAYLDFMAGEGRVRPGQVAATGYCLGGRLSFLTAGTFPERVAAAAAFHGSRLLTPEPDSPHLLLPHVRAALYFGVAEIDAMHTAETTRLLEAALKDAGSDFQLEVYAKASHGFAVDDTPAYDRDFSERHWSALLALLARTLH